MKKKRRDMCYAYYNKYFCEMKKVVFIFLFLGFVVGGEGQNLVPNSSFEIYSNCPNSSSQINYAIPWYSATVGTPDYYNVCAGSGVGTPGVPQNFIGNQNARTGVAYAGIHTCSISFPGANERKEYIQIQLIDSLVAQKKYCVSFYVNLAIPYIGGPVHNTIAITELGMYISNDTISLQNQNTLPYVPQIQSPFGFYLNDSTNWIEISGQYIAHGGEKYITIGNFNLHTDTIGVINENSSTQSYYYIDDVSVIDCTGIGIEESNKEANSFIISPNPTNGIFTISTEENKTNKIKAINVLGQCVFKTTTQNLKTTIDISDKPTGIYFVQITDENKNVVNRKVVVQ